MNRPVRPGPGWGVRGIESRRVVFILGLREGDPAR